MNKLIKYEKELYRQGYICLTNCPSGKLGNNLIANVGSRFCIMECDSFVIEKSKNEIICNVNKNGNKNKIECGKQK